MQNVEIRVVWGLRGHPRSPFKTAKPSIQL